MKPIVINYCQDGIMLQNMRLKDTITLQFNTTKFESKRLTTKILQSYHLEEIIGFITIETVLFIITVFEKKDICSIENKKIYQVDTIEIYPILPLDQWKNISQSMKEILLARRQFLHCCRWMQTPMQYPLQRH